MSPCTPNLTDDHYTDDERHRRRQRQQGERVSRGLSRRGGPEEEQVRRVGAAHRSQEGRRRQSQDAHPGTIFSAVSTFDFGAKTLSYKQPRK